MGKVKSTVEDLDLNLYTKRGTPRKRKPKVKREYFNQETEDAIIQYNSATDEVFRNHLFNTQINYSIHKLAENIINTYKFPYALAEVGGNIDDLKHEVVYFLLTKLPKYNPLEGRAYSYFGTVALRYLINSNKKLYAIEKKKKDMESVDIDKKVHLADRENRDNTDISYFVKSYVKYVENHIDDIHVSERMESTKDESGEITKVLKKDLVIFNDQDKKIVYTVLDLMKKAEYIPEDGGFLKPALYFHIKQATGQRTIDVTRVIKILKGIMKKQLNQYYLKGHLNVVESDIYIQ